MSDKRIKYMDVAKGIGIVSVIIGHMELPALLSHIIFSFHMPLFFVISGCFFKKADYHSLCVKKGKQLLLPYTATCAGVILFAFLRDVLEHRSLRRICRDMVKWLWASFYGSGGAYYEPYYIKMIGAVWFLLALFFGCLILNYALSLPEPGLEALVIVIMGVGGYFSAKIIWLPFSVQAGMLASVYLYIGYRIKGRLDRDILNCPAFLAISWCIWILYLYCGGGQLYLVRNHLEYGVVDIVASVCAVVCVIWISKCIQNSKIGSVFVWMGRNSLMILGFHLIELNTFPWEKLSSFLVSRSLENYYIIVAYVIKFIWAAGATYILLRLKERFSQEKNILPMHVDNVEKEAQNRVEWIDIAKGLAIALMVLGHLSLPGRVRTIIFSFHMPLFFVTAGYFYKQKTWGELIRRRAKSLVLPYVSFVFLALLIALWKCGFYAKFSFSAMIDTAKIYLASAACGISFSSTILTNVKSVGPVWFVICLFFSTLLFSLLQRIISGEFILGVVAALVCILGVVIGKNYAFLPYSLDVSMVGVVFLYFGHILGKYDWLNRMDCLKIYGLFEIIWMISIYYGGIELAVRKYPAFPLCIVGGMAGVCMVLKLSQLLQNVSGINKLLSYLGRNSMMILGIHCLEISFCAWGNIMPNASVWMQFLIKMILILSIIQLWYFIKCLYRERGKM